MWPFSFLYWFFFRLPFSLKPFPNDEFWSRQFVSCDFRKWKHLPVWPNSATSMKSKTKIESINWIRNMKNVYSVYGQRTANVSVNFDTCSFFFFDSWTSVNCIEPFSITFFLFVFFSQIDRTKWKSEVRMFDCVILFSLRRRCMCYYV